MEQSIFDLHKTIESSWWYRGRIQAVLAAVGYTPAPETLSAIDYGAGYGGMEGTCEHFAKTVDAFEPNEEARSFASKRGYRKTFSEGQDALKGHHDYICLFDVLEHIEDDGNFLELAKHTLEPSGRLVVTVPAYMSLWSEHDVANHHYRRYTKDSLCELLVAHGYVIEYASYWNCLLLIPAALMRLVGKSGKEGLTPPSFINALLYRLVYIEAAILRHTPLPFGLSIVAVAHVGAAKPAVPRLIAKLGFLMRYGISGLIGGAIQTVFLYIWVSALGFSRTYFLGLVFGFVIALVVNFILQKYWTFRDRQTHHTSRQFLLYGAIALAGLALNIGLLAGARILLESLGVNFFNGWYLVVQILNFCIVSAFTLCMNFLFTFRDVRRTHSYEK